MLCREVILCKEKLRGFVWFGVLVRLEILFQDNWKQVKNLMLPYVRIESIFMVISWLELGTAFTYHTNNVVLAVFIQLPMF